MTAAVRYLSLIEVKFIHARQIQRYGGAAGILNEGSLESAVYRPQQAAFGQEAHAGLDRKAAALLQSLALNHAFMDGNKRTAFAAAGQFLRLNGYELRVDADEAERFIVSLAAGERAFDEIVDWLGGNATKL